MATWIAVGLIFAVGGVAHFTRLDTRIAFAVCSVILMLGLGTDWVLMGREDSSAN